MTDLLDLPGFRRLEAPLDADGYRMSAEFLAEPDACQRCGVIAPTDTPLDLQMVCHRCNARFHTD